MSSSKEKILSWIEADRDAIVKFLSEFIRAKSPNPPGDTREACAYVTSFLAREHLAYREVTGKEEAPNIVATVSGKGPGRHLVFNGHMDVFPAIADIPGERSQWSGEISDGRIYGRGAADMKCGTAALIFAFKYLHALRSELQGRLTLTVVSDEETGGRWGSGYLLDKIPEEVIGDCCLDAEPTGVRTVRFGEKGTLRFVVTFHTLGASGAYPHLSKSANKLAARFVQDLEEIENLPTDIPEKIVNALSSTETRAALEESLGKGALEVVSRPTVNVGVIRGGLKINMLSDECVLEVEVRIPPGLESKTVREKLQEIVARYPEATLSIREHHSYPSSWSDPEGEMVGILQRNVEELMGSKPQAIISLGGSDTRFWRARHVPAYLYGPSPKTMARRNEHVTIDEFLHVVRVHTLSAYDYLTRHSARSAL